MRLARPSSNNRASAGSRSSWARNPRAGHSSAETWVAACTRHGIEVPDISGATPNASPRHNVCTTHRLASAPTATSAIPSWMIHKPGGRCPGEHRSSPTRSSRAHNCSASVDTMDHSARRAPPSARTANRALASASGTFIGATGPSGATDAGMFPTTSSTGVLQKIRPGPRAVFPCGSSAHRMRRANIAAAITIGARVPKSHGRGEVGGSEQTVSSGGRCARPRRSGGSISPCEPRKCGSRPAVSRSGRAFALPHSHKDRRRCRATVPGHAGPSVNRPTKLDPPGLVVAGRTRLPAPLVPVGPMADDDHAAQRRQLGAGQRGVFREIAVPAQGGGLPGEMGPQ
jgi:hypothetical protein